MWENNVYDSNIQKSEPEITKEIDNLESEIEKLDDYCNKLWVLKEKKRMELKTGMQRYRVSEKDIMERDKETVEVPDNLQNNFSELA